MRSWNCNFRNALHESMSEMGMIFDFNILVEWNVGQNEYDT